MRCDDDLRKRLQPQLRAILSAQTSARRDGVVCRAEGRSNCSAFCAIYLLCAVLYSNSLVLRLRADGKRGSCSRPPVISARSASTTSAAKSANSASTPSPAIASCRCALCSLFCARARVQFSSTDSRRVRNAQCLCPLVHILSPLSVSCLLSLCVLSLSRHVSISSALRRPPRAFVLSLLLDPRSVVPASSSSSSPLFGFWPLAQLARLARIAPASCRASSCEAA
jgi:hypothetical protein